MIFWSWSHSAKGRRFVAVKTLLFASRRLGGDAIYLFEGVEFQPRSSETFSHKSLYRSVFALILDFSRMQHSGFRAAFEVLLPQNVGGRRSLFARPILSTKTRYKRSPLPTFGSPLPTKQREGRRGPLRAAFRWALDATKSA